MATPKPAYVGQTKPNNQHGLTSVPLVPPRKITYVFSIGSSKVDLPYAVAVDGVALSAYRTKPVSAKYADGRVKIIAHVNQGQKVSLFLNSDAHPSYRKHPVYEVVAGERDIVVNITEKAGKHTDADTPTKQVGKDAKAEAAKQEDTYIATLTGDIWMKVSHKYSADEVDALMPAGTSTAVLEAVKQIYTGLSKAELTITEPAAGAIPARKLHVTFSDSNNPRQNITAYTLLGDGVTRVHPGGYAALFNAALENDVTALTVTSCWRPMMGSIAHRAGLGLDVAYVGDIQINRAELRQGKGHGLDTPNVSDEEVKRFNEFEEAIKADKRAKLELDAAILAAKKPGLSALEKTRADQCVNEAQNTKREKNKAQLKAQKDWNDERDANEPAKVKHYRTSLLQCDCVAQLFDPWYMDSNTHDKVAPEPNMQRPLPPSQHGISNEELHANHLHITVYEPKIR